MERVELEMKEPVMGLPRVERWSPLLPKKVPVMAALVVIIVVVAEGGNVPVTTPSVQTTLRGPVQENSRSDKGGSP